MSETNFTPGPWVARIEDHSFCDTGDVFTSFTVATEGAGKYDCFAEVFTRNDDIYEAAANTRLIAAAPELYEFIRWIRSVQGQCAIMKWRKFLPEILDKADEILQKARGEE